VFIKTHLKELQIKNREDGESNHRIVAWNNLQCYLYNVGELIGGNLGEKSLKYDFAKNEYGYSIDETPLCWFECITYFLQPSSGKQSASIRIAKARQCFNDFYGYSNLEEINRKRRQMSMQGFILIEEIDRFITFFDMYLYIC
jgi:hypothetical protein